MQDFYLWQSIFIVWYYLGLSRGALLDTEHFVTLGNNTKPYCLFQLLASSLKEISYFSASYLINRWFKREWKPLFWMTVLAFLKLFTQRQVSDLWLVHPRVVHASVSLCFLEGIRWVNWNPLLWVVQGHVARSVCVTLADPLQFGVGEPAWGCPHVQGVLAPLYVVKILNHRCWH